VKSTRLTTLIAGTILLGSLVGAGANVALAQDDEVTVGPSHPAHIHAGTCAEFDPNPVAPLTNIEQRLNEDEEDNAPQGILTAATVLYSQSEEVELNFEDDVLAASHVIAVHESEENIQNYIACADIGGVVVDGSLVVSLQPMNDSGYSGIAVLGTDDNGQVDVEIYFAEPVTTEPTEPTSTEPAATPAA
jgi:hypothetical protein